MLKTSENRTFCSFEMSFLHYSKNKSMFGHLGSIWKCIFCLTLFVNYIFPPQNKCRNASICLKLVSSFC